MFWPHPRWGRFNNLFRCLSFLTAFGSDGVAERDYESSAPDREKVEILNPFNHENYETDKLPQQLRDRGI